MRAIHVDADRKTLREVQLDGEANTLYQLLTRVGARPVENFELVEIGNGVFAWVDGEALIQRPLPVAWFWPQGHEKPIAGNAILVGHCDDQGDETPPPVSVVEAASRMKFIGLQEVCYLFAGPKN